MMLERCYKCRGWKLLKWSLNKFIKHLYLRCLTKQNCVFIERITVFFFPSLSNPSAKNSGTYFHFWCSRKNISRGFVRVKLFLWLSFILLHPLQLIWRFADTCIQVNPGSWKLHWTVIITSKMCQIVSTRAFTILFSVFSLKKNILVLRTFTYKWIPSYWLCQTAVITFKRCQHDIATLFCQKLECCLVGLNISDWNTSCDLWPWFSNFSVQKNWGYH